MTDRYAVFGNPIAHSKSPLIHRLFAEQTGEDITYDKERVELGDFERAARQFFDEGGKGLNVTVPFKLDAFAFAEQNGSVSERARLAEAVNTLKKIDDEKILGDNTDGIGFVRDITQNLGWEIKGKHILMLGAGGAVRGVMGPLLEQEPRSVTILNRTLQKADGIKKIYSEKSSIIHTWATAGHPPDTMPLNGYDLIINGTPAGLLDNDENWFLGVWIMQLPFASDCRVYDMVYGKSDSPFKSAMKSKGVSEENSADGLGMLVEQAAESFFIWRGIRPETKGVIAKVRQEL